MADPPEPADLARTDAPDPGPGDEHVPFAAA